MIKVNIKEMNYLAVLEVHYFVFIFVLFSFGKKDILFTYH